MGPHVYLGPGGGSKTFSIGEAQGAPMSLSHAGADQQTNISVLFDQLTNIR
jgi:hypothetical protein